MGDPSITGGGRSGVVPADVAADRSLSVGARWLFVFHCTHADGDSRCRLRQSTIADTAGVTNSAVRQWLTALERGGRLVKHMAPGNVDEFEIIRDPDRARQLRAIHNIHRQRPLFRRLIKVSQRDFEAESLVGAAQSRLHLARLVGPGKDKPQIPVALG